ncbi:MAG TPA: cob(I)yrinic acid a,c-diamide adenosyltransferase [Candidatus Kapabacteria bacterium]|nr:cob(I)yrinic acid a,c-diamide adenosyltransferase [Candidatus Kapabacteria bacterium]
MKIYTKTGDDGTTGLFAGGRVRKDSFQIRAYGDVDELNSHLGKARSLDTTNIFADVFDKLQRLLFNLGADLATPLLAKNTIPRIIEADAPSLEVLIDKFELELPPLTHFILPGGSELASELHIARTVARRAEREIVSLTQSEDIGNAIEPFINRLSDLLFVMARYANFKLGVAENPWIP